MSGDFKFQVTVSGMDLDAWAIDYGIDREKADADFTQFAVDQLTGALDELLHRQGYHDQTVEVKTLR